MIHTRIKSTPKYENILELNSDNINGIAKIIALRDGKIVLLGEKNNIYNDEMRELDNFSFNMEELKNKDIVEFTLCDSTVNDSYEYITGLCRNGDGICQNFIISIQNNTRTVSFKERQNGIFLVANGKAYKHTSSLRARDSDDNVFWIPCADDNVIDAYRDQVVTYRDDNIILKHKNFLIDGDGYLCDLDRERISVGDYSDIIVKCFNYGQNTIHDEMIKKIHAEYNLVEDLKIRLDGSQEIDTRIEQIVNNVAKTTKGSYKQSSKHATSISRIAWIR